MNSQKVIADLIKKIQWLRQNPEVREEQLQEVVKHLEEAVTALEK